MLGLLAILPFYPLVSFLLLITFRQRLSWGKASLLSVGAMLLCTITSLVLAHSLNNFANQVMTVQLWQWFTLLPSDTATGESVINVAFYLDALSAVMICVVSGVGFLIHLFAMVYMKNDKNYTRFMAYMNLFIVAMLILVLADNLVLLYLGWEGVGLCSFLLIGFWYQEKANVIAARKAFIVTRVGDTAMAIGLFMLFKSLGSLNIQEVVSLATLHWLVGSEQAYWICLMLLGGAVGKSAQLPLQTWLPDAMAGPTPVSALIHAATMVTAGVYLIARLNGLFILSPTVMHYVAWVGAATLLIAGCAALAQSDIKRILAYSTMSQIGYMMLGLGAGAWSAAIFHLMTHAFFKALLFLTAGTVILALHHQQNIFKMGGLAKKIPFETCLFAIGLLCLMAIPGTSGFFSKEAIIGQLWSSTTAGPSFWWCAILGALLTSIYSCRLFILAFLGQTRVQNAINKDTITSITLKIALLTLAVLSLLGGFISLTFSGVLPSVSTSLLLNQPHWLHSVAIATPFVGIIFSWFYFSGYRSGLPDYIIETETNALTNKVTVFCRNGLGFDNLYHQGIVKPFTWLAHLNRRDVIDQLLMSASWYVKLWQEVLSYSQNGLLRWYAAGFALGAVFLIGAWLL
jgi:NADH-quinone oxidoreductase subunit L